jgi:hypothetical protein
MLIAYHQLYVYETACSRVVIRITRANASGLVTAPYCIMVYRRHSVTQSLLLTTLCISMQHLEPHSYGSIPQFHRVYIYAHPQGRPLSLAHRR